MVVIGFRIERTTQNRGFGGKICGVRCSVNLYNVPFSVCDTPHRSQNNLPDNLPNQILTVEEKCAILMYDSCLRQLFHDTSPPPVLVPWYWSEAKHELTWNNDTSHFMSSEHLQPHSTSNHERTACLLPDKRATLVIIVITRSTEVFYTQPSSRVMNHS